MDLRDERGTSGGTEEMARSQAETAIKKERALRNRCKKYGITPEFYNALGELQGWCCAACGRPQSDFATSLNIDHQHLRVRAQRAQRSQGGWLAGDPDIAPDVFWGKTKQQAISTARQVLLPKSVRGLLCPGRYAGCNRLLGRVDRIQWLESILRYLKNTPAEQIRKRLTNNQQSAKMTVL